MSKIGVRLVAGNCPGTCNSHENDRFKVYFLNEKICWKHFILFGQKGYGKIIDCLKIFGFYVLSKRERDITVDLLLMQYVIFAFFKTRPPQLNSLNRICMSRRA